MATGTRLENGCNHVIPSDKKVDDMLAKNGEEYYTKYNRETYKRYIVKARKDKDADMIEYLESVENVGAYIKELIRKDMKKRKK